MKINRITIVLVTILIFISTFLFLVHKRTQEKEQLIIHEIKRLNDENRIMLEKLHREIDEIKKEIKKIEKSKAIES